MLETIRELKNLNVDVFFEEQNIHSISADGELMISFLASYAQEESRSASENLKWSIRNRFKKGVAWNTHVYGYQFSNGTFITIPAEAEIVKQIFASYLDGNGTPAIAKDLNKRDILTKLNKPGVVVKSQIYYETISTPEICCFIQHTRTISSINVKSSITEFCQSIMLKDLMKPLLMAIPMKKFKA